jgi:hypothetical protein
MEEKFTINPNLIPNFIKIIKFIKLENEKVKEEKKDKVKK